MKTATRQTTARPHAATLDADERAVLAFHERVNRRFRALTRSLTFERKLALLAVAGELDSEGFISSFLLNGTPTSRQGETWWRLMGLQS